MNFTHAIDPHICHTHTLSFTSARALAPLSTLSIFISCMSQMNTTRCRCVVSIWFLLNNEKEKKIPLLTACFVDNDSNNNKKTPTRKSVCIYFNVIRTYTRAILSMSQKFMQFTNFFFCHQVKHLARCNDRELFNKAYIYIIETTNYQNDHTSLKNDSELIDEINHKNDLWETNPFP